MSSWVIILFLCGLNTGKWITRFSQTSQKENFHLDGEEPVHVPMMHQTNYPIKMGKDSDIGCTVRHYFSLQPNICLCPMILHEWHTRFPCSTIWKALHGFCNEFLIKRLFFKNPITHLTNRLPCHCWDTTCFALMCLSD